MQYFDIDIGDQLNIGESEVVFVEKKGRKVRVSVQADRSIPVKLSRPGYPTEKTKRDKR